MLDSLALRPLIEKTRHVVEAGGRRWEVDVFAGANAGLVVAEIELESADAPLQVPAWAGSEVTDDPRYYNANLSPTPTRSGARTDGRCRVSATVRDGPTGSPRQWDLLIGPAIRLFLRRVCHPSKVAPGGMVFRP